MNRYQSSIAIVSAVALVASSPADAQEHRHGGQREHAHAHLLYAAIQALQATIRRWQVLDYDEALHEMRRAAEAQAASPGAAPGTSPGTTPDKDPP